MEFKKNEIKTGLMLLVSLAVLSAFLIAMFGLGIGKESNQYTVYVDYIGGISKGSLVKYVGMNVGQVTDIKLTERAGTPIEVSLKVDREIPVRNDSRAFITALGMMSEYHIEVSPGSPDAGMLPNGGTIASKEVLSYPKMAEDMGGMTEQIQQVMAQVTEILSDNNRERLNTMMENMDGMIGGSRNDVLAAVRNFRTVSEDLKLFSESVNASYRNNSVHIDSILSNVSESSAQSQEVMQRMQSTISSLQLAIQANNQNITQILSSYQVSSRNLEEITNMLKERPWLLIRKAAPEERDLP